jgi:hypothetical protein
MGGVKISIPYGSSGCDDKVNRGDVNIDIIQMDWKAFCFVRLNSLFVPTFIIILKQSSHFNIGTSEEVE